MATDVLPNIFVNLNQVKSTRGNVIIPFNATVFMKTKTGPIGEFTRLTSYADAVKIFGLGDNTTTALYGVEQVLKSYGYLNVVRIASNLANKSSVTLTNTNASETRTITTYEVATSYVSGTQYYVLNVVDTYEPVAISEFAPGVTYYVKVVNYVEVPAGAEFDPEETYYILDDDVYTEVEITEFDPEVTYYTANEIYEEATEYVIGTQYYTLTSVRNYNAVTISEFAPGTTYYIQVTETITIGSLGDVITGESDYKTDIYNGDVIKLIYNATRTRLAITGELAGTVYTTPYEIIDLSTANAEEDERVLNKLVADWNSLNTGFTLENKFINKTSEDQAISEEDTIMGTIQLGNSGNDNTITNDDVISLFEVIEDPRIETQDVVICPEFRNFNVVNAGLEIKNKYFYITVAQGSDLTAKQDSIANFNVSDQGVMYIPDGCTMVDETITVPFEVAALYAWAKSYSESRYLAPAGINRATLDIVSNVLNNLSDDDSVIMYNLDKPANPVKYVTNYGFTIYGQKTMDASQTFTNRVNVSGLVQYVTIHAKELLNPYIFEYTPISTFQKVYLDIDKLLQALVTQDVLYNDYQIVCDSSNNTNETLSNHELHVAVAIRPVNVTEYIYLDLTVTDDLGGEE